MTFSNTQDATKNRTQGRVIDKANRAPSNWNIHRLEVTETVAESLKALLMISTPGSNAAIQYHRPQPNMDSLPPELLELIITHSMHSTQKSLRQLNHRFHDLATSPIFEDFYIAPCIFAASLKTLENLINSPKELGKHIKHLHFYTDILPPWDRYEFEAKAAKHLDAGGLNGEFGERDRDEVLKAAWHRFDDLRTQQTEWFYENDGYLRVFKELLSSLPNLASATAGMAMPFQGSTARWPVWQRLKSSNLVSPDDWMFDELEEVRRRDHRMAQSTRGTLNLLEAIGFRSSFAGMSQVKDLKIHALSNGRWKSLLAGRISDDATLRTFAPDVETRFQMLLAPFAHLTTLDLHVPCPVTETSRHFHEGEFEKLFELQGAEISAILASARNLRSLRFAYDSESASLTWASEEEEEHPLYALFGASETKALPWPKLEHLDLSANVPHTLLLSFLAPLAPTLRKLQLRDMCVSDAQALFAELPKVLKLQDAYLECIWTVVKTRDEGIIRSSVACGLCEGLDVDRQYERDLKAYLLGYAEDLPPLPAELTCPAEGDAWEPEMAEEDHAPAWW